MSEINQRRLSDIICENTDLPDLTEHVFVQVQQSWVRSPTVLGSILSTVLGSIPSTVLGSISSSPGLDPFNSPWFDPMNSPGFDPNILRHSRIWGAADEAVLNKVHNKKSQKNLLVNVFVQILSWIIPFIAEEIWYWKRPTLFCCRLIIGSNSLSLQLSMLQGPSSVPISYVRVRSGMQDDGRKDDV